MTPFQHAFCDVAALAPTDLNFVWHGRKRKETSHQDPKCRGRKKKKKKKLQYSSARKQQTQTEHKQLNPRGLV